jgi:CHASE1-domain containing sensor protein
MKRYQWEKANILTILQKRSFVVLALIICGGIALSIFMYGTVLNQQQIDRQGEFEATAKEYTSAIQKRIDLNLLFLNSIGSFYNGSDNVTRGEFRIFVEPFLKQLAGIQAVEWIPLVPHSQRKLFEEIACKDGIADFQITEKQSQGRLVPAADRSEYFPVYFVEPYQCNASAMGFDLR